jgi:hypothetical protein
VSFLCDCEYYTYPCVFTKSARHRRIYLPPSRGAALTGSGVLCPLATLLSTPRKKRLLHEAIVKSWNVSMWCSGVWSGTTCGSLVRTNYIHHHTCRRPWRFSHCCKSPHVTTVSSANLTFLPWYLYDASYRPSRTTNARNTCRIPVLGKYRPGSHLLPSDWSGTAPLDATSTTIYTHAKSLEAEANGYMFQNSVYYTHTYTVDRKPREK